MRDRVYTGHPIPLEPLITLYKIPIESPEYELPADAVAVKIQMLSNFAGAQSKYMVKSDKEWHTLDRADIYDKPRRVRIKLEDFPTIPENFSFKVSIAYVSQQHENQLKELGLDLPVTPYVSLIINEQTVVIELAGPLPANNKVVIPRKDMDRAYGIVVKGGDTTRVKVAGSGCKTCGPTNWKPRKESVNHEVSSL